MTHAAGSKQGATAFYPAEPEPQGGDCILSGGARASIIGAQSCLPVFPGCRSVYPDVCRVLRSNLHHCTPLAHPFLSVLTKKRSSCDRKNTDPDLPGLQE
jgi:hypothetical protein